MIESIHVLNLMKGVYVIYAVIVFLLIGLYVFRITTEDRIQGRKGSKIKISLFYGWIGFLVFVGVGLHILTFNKIPWVKWDLSRDKVNIDREFNIAIADYKFHLPAKTLLIQEGEMVRFNLESSDYTYGFGLFREDGTMVFQMQVVPDKKNDIVWKFERGGTYSIRSTEYSGPRGGDLHVKNAVVVAPENALAQLTSPVDIPQDKLQKTN